MNDKKKSQIDAATGRWLNNAQWIFILIATAGITFGSGRYVGMASPSKAVLKAMEKHVTEHPERLKEVNKIVSGQTLINGLIQKDLEIAKGHRIRMDGKIDQILQELKRIKFISSSETTETSTLWKRDG